MIIMKRRYAVVVGMMLLLLTGCAGTEETVTSNETETGQEEVLTQETVQEPETSPEEPETGEAKESERVVQDGPYGRISLTIPEGWAYETCPVGDERLLSAAYGIQFHPADVTEGYIEVGYHTNFGVCGTGLSEETTTLAGDSARIGYYDGNSAWGFISFDGKNKQIVALSSNVDTWWQRSGVEVMTILDSLSFDTAQQSGAIGVDDEDSGIPEIALTVFPKEISAQGCTLVFTQYDREAATELSFGEDFRIEEQKDGKWQEAETVVQGEYGFDAVAHSIRLEDTTEYVYDWEWLYGTLEPGEYRIAVNVNDLRAAGDYDSYTLYAHFILR